MSTTTTFEEYRITVGAGEVTVWEGLAESPTDAFGEWLSKNPHLAAIYLAGKELPQCSKV